MNLGKIWKNQSLWIAFCVYVLLALLATAQGLFAPVKTFVHGGMAYKDYNNYVIFKESFFHLLAHQDLYRYFPSDHWDLYKYSPTFALFFSFMSVLPDWLGLPTWLLLNALVLFLGVALLPSEGGAGGGISGDATSAGGRVRSTRLIPALSDQKKTLILLFCAPEMLLSLQNDQSNALMAGLIILALALAERSKYFLSSLCIVLSVYIKIYGGLAFILYLFYPGKLRLALYSVFWTVLLAFLPLVVVDMHQLDFLYRSWYRLLMEDRSASVGVSVEGILESWFHSEPHPNIVALAGLAVFLLPFVVSVRRYKEYAWRLLMLSSLLIWIVIFNHKAESPTFVIAMSGIGLWYFGSIVPKALDLGLLVAAFILVTLSVSDAVPWGIRQSIVQHYDLKAIAPLCIWFRITLQAILPTVRSGSPIS